MGPIIVLAFGDSITAGKCDKDGGGWPARLARCTANWNPNAMFYNLGVNGETAADISDRWESERALRVPDGVTSIQMFAFGLNDCTLDQDGAPRLTLEASLDRAIKMISASKRLGSTLWIGPTPIDEATQPSTSVTGETRTKKNSLVSKFNDRYRACALDLKVPYLDLYSSFWADTQWLRHLADGTHPTNHGYDLLTLKISTWSGWIEAISQTD